MNEMKIFQHEEFGKFGLIEIDGKPYFPAKRCAEALGYKDTINAIKQHCRWVVKHHLPHPQSPDKTIEVNYIPEGDLYRLIARSNLPGAEKFERWVFDEVLPKSAGTASAGDIKENPSAGNIKIFEYGEREVRTVIKDGEPWWVLKDVCDVLGIANVTDTQNRLEDDEKAELDLIEVSSNGVRQTRKRLIVNESGLYNVTLRSDKPEGKWKWKGGRNVQAKTG